MKISNHSAVPVYTISGSSTARPLPEWLARKRKRSLKNDPEYASRIELLQDFEFEEASQCVSKLLKQRCSYAYHIVIAGCVLGAKYCNST